MRRIRSRRSALTMGRPDRRRLFHAQYRRNPCRCQPTTVSGRTTCSECRQLVHSLDSKTQNIRSVSVSRGRGPLPYGELLPKRKVLERQLALRTKTASQCPEEDSEPSDHDGSN